MEPSLISDLRLGWVGKDPSAVGVLGPEEKEAKAAGEGEECRGETPVGALLIEQDAPEDGYATPAEQRSARVGEEEGSDLEEDCAGEE